MSRGHGTRQRTILAALTAHAAHHPPMDDFDTDGQLKRGDVPPSFLTAADLASGTTTAALESTKRALRKLKTANAIELCHGFNHLLGARITPPEEIRAQSWLALDDHQHVQWHIDSWHRWLWNERAKLKVCEDYEEERLREGIAYYQEKARMTYAEVRQSCIADKPTCLPSEVAKREANPQPLTEEEERRNAELMVELAAAFGTAQA